jgi:hypothetical protein
MDGQMISLNAPEYTNAIPELGKAPPRRHDMRLYPLFADLNGLPVLVVGGGNVAERKVAALLDACSLVGVGAPH